MAGIVDVGEFDPGHADGQGLLPDAFQQRTQQGIDFRFHAGGFADAFGALNVFHPGITDAQGDGAGQFAVGAYLFHQTIQHLLELDLDFGGVAQVFGKGSLFAVGFGVFIEGNDRAVIDAESVSFQIRRVAADRFGQEFQRRVAQVEDFEQSQFVQQTACLFAYARHPAVGKRIKEHGFGTGRYQTEAFGFVHLGGDLCDQFAGAHADAHGDAESGADLIADGLSQGLDRFAAAGQVEISLINGALFHDRRVLTDDVKHLVGKTLIEGIASRDQYQFRADLPGLSRGHGSIDTPLACRVRGRGNDPALSSADRDSFTAQFGIHRLFHGGEKSICVQMDDLAEVLG